jgi:hypothetical protein
LNPRVDLVVCAAHGCKDLGWCELHMRLASARGEDESLIRIRKQTRQSDVVQLVTIESQLQACDIESSAIEMMRSRGSGSEGKSESHPIHRSLASLIFSQKEGAPTETPTHAHT